MGWFFLKFDPKVEMGFHRILFKYFFQTEISGTKGGFEFNFQSKSLKFLRGCCFSYAKIVSFIKTSLSFREA